MYSKELLVNTFLHRYRALGDISDMEVMANKFYDEAGRDKFRLYACVTPEAIREYKNASKTVS